MLNIVSLLIGAIALLLAIFAFIPLLGIFNWLIVGLAIIGAGIGAIGKSTSGRNLNLVVILICVLRLWLGGGIF